MNAISKRNYFQFIRVECKFHQKYLNTYTGCRVFEQGVQKRFLPKNQHIQIKY